MRFVLDSKPTVIVELWVCESSVGVHNEHDKHQVSAWKFARKNKQTTEKKSLNGL